MLVRERITVQAAGIKIKRGIFRVFPVNYTTADGGVHYTGFEFMAAKMNGSPVPAEADRDGADMFIRIGDPNGRVSRGVHTYEILFQVTDHLRFLADRDALYWNVTGNNWDFPIDKVTCHIVLPGGDSSESAIMVANAYTGKAGAVGTDWQLLAPATFATTRPLNRQEGLTVALDWKPGLVERNTSLRNQVSEFFSAHQWLRVAILPFCALLIFGTIWFRYGRDPKLGTIVPSFAPPQGMMPGMMAMLRSMKAVPLCFTSNLLQLAVQGAVKLQSPKNGVMVITHTGGDDAVLWDDTSAHNDKDVKTTKKFSDVNVLRGMLTYLFPSSAPEDNQVDSRVNLKNIHDSYEHCARSYNTFANQLFARNYGYFGLAAGIMILLICLLLLFVIPSPAINGIEDLVAIGLILFFCIGALGVLLFWLRNMFVRRRYNVVIRYLLIILMLFFVGGFAIGGIGALLAMDMELTVALLLVFPIALFFLRIMPLPSKECIRLLTMIEGLAMYIEAAEKERLAILNAPEDTVERFELILPYALALGCAEAWERRFAPLLDKLNYTPSWTDAAATAAYAGSMVWQDVIRTYTKAMPDAYAQAVSSYKADIARTTSSWSGGGGSSSSGSSGGSSGGGSGGGGGGGW